ncbi:MAG: exo-alpha-sialidase [Verrucomicrobiota bacterium]
MPLPQANPVPGSRPRRHGVDAAFVCLFWMTLLPGLAQTPPQRQLLFPLESWHNHGSSLVEAPNGDLLACWFHGSGERKADDVRIEAARLPKGSDRWSPRFTLADTPGYPDCNPSLHVDPSQRLWLFYPTILDNRWEGALLKYQVSSNWLGSGAPRWDRTEVLHVTPGPEFEEGIRTTLPRLESLAAEHTRDWSDATRREVREYLDSLCRTRPTSSTAASAGCPGPIRSRSATAWSSGCITTASRWP